MKRKLKNMAKRETAKTNNDESYYKNFVIPCVIFLVGYYFSAHNGICYSDFTISLGHIIKTVYLFLITYSNSSKFSYPNSIKTWRLCFLSSSVLNLGIMGRRRMILSLCLA